MPSEIPLSLTWRLCNLLDKILRQLRWLQNVTELQLWQLLYWIFAIDCHRKCEFFHVRCKIVYYKVPEMSEVLAKVHQRMLRSLSQRNMQTTDCIRLYMNKQNTVQLFRRHLQKNLTVNFDKAMIMKYFYGALLSHHVKPCCDPPALLAYQPDELPDRADVSQVSTGSSIQWWSELPSGWIGYCSVLHNRTYINCQGSCLYWCLWVNVWVLV